MIAIWLIYCLTAVAASGAFIVAGWRGRSARELASRQTWGGLPRDPLWAEDETQVDVTANETDLSAAIRLALKRLAPVMASQLVKVEVAAPAGLLVRMTGAVLADLLEELLAAAIHGAPASRLLIAASLHGDNIHLSVTDDRPGADQAARAAAVRGLMQRVAMRGGALEVDVHPAEGTTTTLQLAGDRLNHQDRDLTAPAAAPADP